LRPRNIRTPAPTADLWPPLAFVVMVWCNWRAEQDCDSRQKGVIWTMSNQNETHYEGPLRTQAPLMDSGSSLGPEPNDNAFRVPEGDSPQGREFADKPGAYSLVSRISRANVDPGDALHVELYFTGYGIIEGGKLLVYPSPSIFDSSESNITAGCRQIGDMITFGGKVWPMDRGGSFWIEVNDTGVKTKGWKRSTIFFDAIPGTHLLFTEAAFPWTPPKGQFHGPVTLSLKIKDKAKSGQYDVRFALTYYNGESWVTCPETAQFSVTTWYQRWETPCQIAAVVAAGIALLAFVAQLLPFVAQLVKWVGIR